MKEKNPKRQREAAPSGVMESPAGSSEDIRKLRYELSEHQVELKAQNEELQQAQLETSHARDRYKELFDTAPVGYLVLDGSFMIRDASHKAASLLGTPRKHLIGTPLSKFMDRQEADAYFLHLLEVRKRGAQQSRDLAFRRPDGSHFHGHLEASPYEDSLFGNGWRIALVDITSLKQAEEALRASEEALRQSNESLERKVLERTEQLEQSRRALRKLASELVITEERERKRVALVLHDDIAQILATIRLRLDLLQDVPSDSKDKQTLTEAKSLLLQSLRETRALMNDLGNPLLFDMGLEPACEALANRLMEKHPVRIRCEMRDSYKHLDPDTKALLYQVIRELLNNVVKHSQALTASVMVDMEDGRFRVKVADDGAGFDPRALGTPAVAGGYGLYSIRERLIAVDGSLKIESAPGAGTVVTATLPAASQ